LSYTRIHREILISWDGKSNQCSVFSVQFKPALILAFSPRRRNLTAVIFGGAGQRGQLALSSAVIEFYAAQPYQ